MPTSSFAIVLPCMALIFASGVAGMFVRKGTPDGLWSTNTVSLIQFILGLTSSLSALVLGLLVAASFSLFTAQKTSVETLSARAVQLDRLLRQFGPEAAPGRKTLKAQLDENYQRIWGSRRPDVSSLGISQVAATTDDFSRMQAALSVDTEAEKSIISKIDRTAEAMQEIRDLMTLQIVSPVTWPLLVILAMWTSFLFFGYGLLSDLNKITVFWLAGGALVVSGAILLILELSHPYDGLIRIPSSALETAIEVVSRH